LSIPDEGYSRAYLMKDIPETYLMKDIQETYLMKDIPERT
jgi:hypothetical protein